MPVWVFILNPRAQKIATSPVSRRIIAVERVIRILQAVKDIDINV